MHAAVKTIFKPAAAAAAAAAGPAAGRFFWHREHLLELLAVNTTVLAAAVAMNLNKVRLSCGLGFVGQSAPAPPSPCATSGTVLHRVGEPAVAGRHASSQRAP